MRARLFVSAALLATALVACPPVAFAEEPALPAARDVVVRRPGDLAAALRIALRPALAHPGRDVALVVDVTPYTRAGAEALLGALIELERDAPDVASWRIARLGGAFGAATREPTGLARALPEVMAEETPVRNTFAALRSTLHGFSADDGVIVYLADWHGEDDHDLEHLIGALRRRHQTLSVVGGEAAFTRAWNDGLFAGPAGSPDPKGGPGSYDPTIGRDPFGQRDPVKPWHGGDTAYPHLPYAFRAMPWFTEFSPNDDYALAQANARADDRTDEHELEDLRERLRTLREDEERRGAAGVHPLPSGWGPYGLMRVAATTGGHYVLWSWNPDGRTDVRYDYARLDHFPPDLRPRHAILADIRSRPLARAAMDAWHLVTQPGSAIAALTPPVEDDLRTPQPLAEAVAGRCLTCEWIDPTDLREHRRIVGKTLAGMDAAITRLDRALDEHPSGLDDIDRRLFADADLFRHALLVLRFSLGEIDGVSRLVGMDAWDRPDIYPMAAQTELLLRGDDPEFVRPRTATVFDSERAARVVADRRRMLDLYRETPWAATVARNMVFTYRLAWVRRVFSNDDGSGSRNPAESVDDTGPTTPIGGGSSNSGSPATGR